MSSLSRRATRVLLLLASVAVTLELSLRAFGAAPLPAAAFPPDHPLQGQLPPHTCQTMGGAQAAYDIQACTDRRGLRDREHEPGESPRVLVLGDSSSFGHGVEQGDTFATQLERALRLGLPGRRPAVFNAGLRSSSQPQQHALLRKLYDEIRPDVVVLAFAERDDIDENIVLNPSLDAPRAQSAYREEVRRESASGGWWYRHSALVRFYGQRDVRSSLAAEREALNESLAQHGLANAPADRRLSDTDKRRFIQAFADRYDRDWDVTRALLDRIVGSVRSQAGRLVLLRIPSRLALDDAAWSGALERFCGREAAQVARECGAVARDHTTRRLSEFAKARNIAYIDPGEALASGVRRGQDIYLPGENHLARLGHARIADSVSRALLPELGGKRAEPVAAEPRASRARRVGAYWYPWYRTRDWSWFTDYVPHGGAYVSTDAAAIARQLRWAERAELDFLLIELVGDHNSDSIFNDRAVDALIAAIVERRRRGHSRLQFAILSDISTAETAIGTNERWLQASRRQLDQIWTRFVEKHREAYLHVEGKPLVALYSPPLSLDDARYTMLRPYWVSHEQWRDWSRKHELVPFWDTYPQTVTDRRFLSVVPGYNDWRLERRPQVAPYLPRRAGHTFAQQWGRAFEVNPDIVLVYSYNEYFEQTQIEPTAEQGDRYLVLNQILARRFKDSQPFTPDELARLPDVIEPPPKTNEEKVTWLPIDDPRVGARGLERLGDGRAKLTSEAELELAVEGDQSVVVGLMLEPSFDACALLSVTLAGDKPENAAYFATELSQLAVVRDFSIPASKKRVKLELRRVPGSSCSDAGSRPIVLTGVTRYPIASKERKSYRVWYDRVRLEGFWDIEKHPSGTYFSWSRDRSSITISGLTPGERHRVTLTFFETAGLEQVRLGFDSEPMQSVAITPARTATLPEAGTVSASGTLKVSLQTATWLPSKLHGSKDRRALGLALRLITLDRVDETAH